MAEFDDKVIGASVKTSKFTAKALLALMKLVVKRIEDGTHHGKMSLKNLYAEGKELENIPINKADILAIKKELKSFNVDFAVKRNKEQGVFQVFFKGQDLSSINLALKNCIQKAAKNTPLKTRLSQAQQKANEINAAKSQKQKQSQKKKQTRGTRQ